MAPCWNGLIGRKAGSVEGYNYSPAMKNSGLTWDEATFREYIKDPRRDGLIEDHHETFRTAIQDCLNGDGLPNVRVTDLREVIPEELARPVSWNAS